MDLIIKETRLNLLIFSNDLLFDKNFFINLINIFCEKIWHEILFQFSNLKKNNFLHYFFINELSFDLYEKTQILIHDKKKIYNFLNVWLEQYLNFRKSKNIILIKDFWKKKFLFDSECFFHLIIKRKKEKFLLIFLFFECFRYEKIKEFLLEKETTEKCKKTIFYFYLQFIPEYHQKLLKNVFEKKIKCKYGNYKQYFSKCMKIFYDNPFFFQKKKILVVFFNYLNSFDSIYSLDFRKIVHNLSISGMIGHYIFWIRKTKRIFHNILINIILKKLEFEIKDLKKDLKTEIRFFKGKKIKHLNIYRSKENLWDFEKIGIIFGSAIVNINFSEEILFDEIFSFKELSVWSKYVSGCAFSVINSKKKNFNRWFWQSIYNDSISDHIKGGIVFGLSLGLKNNYEIERCFYKECEVILKSTLHQRYPVLQYGTCLALSKFFSGTMMSDPRKNRLCLFLRNKINEDNISAEGAALAIGILFFKSGSIFLLKLMLDQIMYISNKIRSKLLFTSIGFIFCKNRDYCDYIFNNLMIEKCPNFRQGALVIYSLGNFMNTDIHSIKALLNYLSNENDDDVKFTIITSIGFIFCSKYKFIKDILSQFINHFNPFIRLGLCFALFLSSIGLKSIGKQLKILYKLTRDQADFVRQGACFCLGLLHYHSISKKGLSKTIKTLKTVINNIYESKITKFGAVLGLNILEAKKNPKIKIKEKWLRKPELLYLFLQYWTWLPNLCFGFEFF
jgi:hypothetical protein